MSDQETPRERFLRNHQEEVGRMLAAARSAELEGDYETAEQIRAIADSWDRIAQKAQGASE